MIEEESSSELVLGLSAQLAGGECEPRLEADDGREDEGDDE